MIQYKKHPIKYGNYIAISMINTTNNLQVSYWHKYIYSFFILVTTIYNTTLYTNSTNVYYNSTTIYCYTI